MSNFKSIKKGEKLEFHGIEIDREYRGEELFSVTVKFEDGNFFTVAKRDWSAIEILVKEPPKLVKKWRVKGQFYDKPFETICDDQYAAEALRDTLGSSTLEIEEFEEPEE